MTITSSEVDAETVDMDSVMQFVFQFAGDLGAALHATTVVIGDRLGLYKALAEGPTTAAGLSARTGCEQRYLQEWLDAQAASGYCRYDPGAGRYSLSAVQALCLADETSPAFLPGGMMLATAAAKDYESIIDAFRSGAGVGWHEHSQELFDGCERFFRPGYVAHLTADWLPALTGVTSKLALGARVADVGCGHGASTILMAQAYPHSRFFGFDYHQGSIDVAVERAERAGVQDRVRFEVAGCQDFPGQDYDLVTVFDALHDMGDPAGGAAHVRSALAHDGTWMIVEPAAGDTPEANHNPVGRVYFSASTMLCTPASKSQSVGLALGAQAGQARITKLLTEAGFSSVRRTSETPLNYVLEARP